MNSRANISTIAFRSMRLTCHLAYGSLLALFYPALKLPTRQRILRRWSAELLSILHVRLEIIGQPTPLDEHGAMLVANHISWLDVFAINAVRPACFVAKSEVRDWPLIGMLCRSARTIFIARDIRRDTLRSNRQIGSMLTEGEYIALFPEGTSTDGTTLKHFHSSLFQGAIDSNSAVIPIAIRYHDGHGKHCDDAAFIGDMSILESLHKVLSSSSLHATLVIAPAISCTGKNRRMLAHESQAAIATALETRVLHVDANTQQHPSSSPFQSAYSLLLDPLLRLKGRHSG